MAWLGLTRMQVAGVLVIVIAISGHLIGKLT